MRDDDVASLAELSGFFTWGTEDEPAPYAPHGGLARESLPPEPSGPAFVDVLPAATKSRRPEWVERLTQLQPNWRRWAPFIAASIVVVLIVVTVWTFSGSDDEPADNANAAAPSPAPVATTTREATTAPEPTVIDPRLIALLPRGYGPGVCRPVRAPRGAVAVAECGANDEAPDTTARYTLATDSQTLKVALNRRINSTATQVCPGNFMSPGPWRRNTNPGVPAGTLVCATDKDSPTVAWTLDEALLLAVITSTPTGPTLPDLYTWWTTHS